MRPVAEPSDPSRRSSDVVAIKKTHLYGAGGVIVGMIVGFAIARAFFMPPAAIPASSLQFSTQAAPTAEPRVVEVDVRGRPARGPAGAKVTIVEFTDYECPFCGRHFQQTYPRLVAEYGERTRYVIRNMPLTNIHPRAQKAAEAAECAYDQGTFWEYHDALFSHQQALEVAQLKQYAIDLGLNATVFNSCLDGGVKADIVRRDAEDAQRYGVTGTPTFFINGRVLVGAQPYETFRSAIESALRAAP